MSVKFLVSFHVGSHFLMNGNFLLARRFLAKARKGGIAHATALLGPAS
jgi:hypothetical protein